MSELPETMRQVAPYPTALAELVPVFKYRPGWAFSLRDIDRGQGSEGLTLIVDVKTVNSYPPNEPMHVRHYMIVPAAAYNARSWRRWLLDQCLLVDRHEGCEFFDVDGDKPFAPHHYPGADPYTIFEVGTDEERRTSFRGVIT